MNAYDFKPIRGIDVAGMSAHQSVTLPNGTVWPFAPPAAARVIMMQALTQNIRYTLTGSTPTATSGFQMKAGDPPILVNLDGVVLKIICETNGAILQYELGE